MPRHGMTWLGIVALFCLFGTGVHADPPEPSSLEAALALQRAMAMAKVHLSTDDPRRAVEVLEQYLSRANGNTAFLELLRDAYRAHIKELGLKRQPAAAELYLKRLSILDPSAVNDPALRPSESPTFRAPAPAPREATKLLPDFKAMQAKIAPPKIEETRHSGPAPGNPGVVPNNGIKAPVFRAIRDSDDPFDLAHQRIAPERIAAMDPARSANLLTKGHEEFGRGHYAEARRCYEQFVQADEKNIEKVRDRLAYCILAETVDQLNNNGAAAPPADLRKQVVGAIALAPQLRSIGDNLLSEIDQRSPGRAPTAEASAVSSVDPPLNMQHYGKNPQGWQVTETTNFRIFHNQNRDLVERVALISERTRRAMARKWFGGDGELWSPKCEIVLHGSASDYSKLTGVPATSPGHSRIETDPTTYRVIGRRIDLHTDTMGMLEAVLPHETTHVVLAGNFGVHQVPRWADEGVAVLTEPLEKIEQHRRNLAKSRKEGALVPVRDLMNLQNYPDARQITTFYAQSVMLVEFLTQQRGPQTFTEFLRDGLKDGYEPALRKHYSWSFAELQANWDQHTGGRQTVAAGAKIR